MTYWRYGDDFVIGIIGSKGEAIAMKECLAEYLR